FILYAGGALPPGKCMQSVTKFRLFASSLWRERWFTTDTNHVISKRRANCSGRSDGHLPADHG
ncbi:MAG: hypothetical protein WAO36_01825, partial [Candidatus Methanoculleus thermohydrogenotrophicum]